jgi:hypothetical protein
MTGFRIFRLIRKRPDDFVFTHSVIPFLGTFPNSAVYLFAQFGSAICIPRHDLRCMIFNLRAFIGLHRRTFRRFL